MDVLVRPVDTASDVELEQLAALSQACERAAFGAVEPQSVAQTRIGLESTPYWHRSTWVAVAETFEGGASIVGSAGMYLPQKENLEAVDVGISVHPAYRGHGIATALLEEALIPAARATGRPLVGSWGEVPAVGEVDDPAHPVAHLAARLGVQRRNVSVCRVLDLPVDDALLDRLEAEARERSADYTILTWEDEVPEEHLVGYGALLRQLDLDDPDEDVEHEPADYTPERIRYMEERRRAQGGRWLATVAVAPDGTLAGGTDIGHGAEPGTTLGWQGNTLVMPEHRGHRLGLAVKVANHRALARRDTGIEVLATWNSHVNPWMIGINERLGYRVAYREIVFQGRPGDPSTSAS